MAINTFFDNLEQDNVVQSLIVTSRFRPESCETPTTSRMILVTHGMKDKLHSLSLDNLHSYPNFWQTRIQFFVHPCIKVTGSYRYVFEKVRHT